MDFLDGASKIISMCNQSQQLKIFEKNPLEDWEECTLNKSSTRPEILDFIMLFLCRRIDLKWNAFKGGFVLTKLLPDEARMTEDIDFSVSEAGQYYSIIPILNELGEVLKANGVIETYEVKGMIGERSTGGIHMRTSKDSKDIKIDIGWHDLSWGVQKWNYEGFDCNRFEVERMLTDKISAVYSRKRFRRPKDIYDIYILLRNFDIDMNKLRGYVEKRGTIEWDSDPFREDVYRELGKAYNSLNIVSISGEHIFKPDFDKVMNMFRFFMSGYNKESYWRFSEQRFD